MGKRGIFLSVLFGVVIAGQFVIMNQKLLHTRRALSNKIKQYRRDQKALIFALHKTVSSIFSLPQELNNVDYSDEIIFDVKDIQIRNVFAPYNASLIENGDDGYLVFFRYDLVRQMHFNSFDAHIGCAWLDEDFKQTEREYLKIETQSCHSEDPRLLKANEDLFLVYNDGPYEDLRDRKMHIAMLDEMTLQPKNITKLNSHLSPVEKNWVPFFHDNAIHFEYQIFTPRKILRLEDPNHSMLTHLKNPLENENLFWEKKWGKPLGGTSARLVNGQYLAFFHSKFKDSDGTYWYVMGAYTFEAKPPFRVTSISKEPLLFKGIYQTESINTSDPRKYVIFPGGFVLRKHGNKTFLHLACGQNDCAVKVLSMDLDALLDSLVDPNLQSCSLSK